MTKNPISNASTAALITLCLGGLGAGLIVAGAITGQWAEVVPGVSTVIGALASALRTSESPTRAKPDPQP